MLNEKLTIGQNLKRIRKDLNLKQYEIAGNDITRNLISLIENDKAPIYYNVANIISKNINKILNQRGLDIYIQAEDILNPERYESRKKANEYIEKLNKHLAEKNYELTVDELNEIENFLNKWNFIDKKVEIYQILGEIYYKAKDPNREYYYFIKALEISYEHPNMKDRYKIISRLVYNCIVTKKYNEAIRLCEFALSTQENLSDRQKGIFHYNLALSYYHLEDYFKALDHIIHAKFYVPCDSNEDMKKILILEGICNSEIKNYDKALKIYEKLVKIVTKDNNIEDICLIYLNIIQIYVDINDKSKAIKYHDILQNYLNNIKEDSSYLPGILFNLSDFYLYINDNKSCENNLIKALWLSKKQKNMLIFAKILSKLVDLYANNNQHNKIILLSEQYEDEIYSLINRNTKVILKLIYSLLEFDYDYTKNLINKLLNKKGDSTYED